PPCRAGPEESSERRGAARAGGDAPRVPPRRRRCGQLTLDRASVELEALESWEGEVRNTFGRSSGGNASIPLQSRACPEGNRYRSSWIVLKCCRAKAAPSQRGKKASELCLRARRWKRQDS